MEDLLLNPAIQSGVAPFLVALLVAAVTLRLGSLYGLAILAGFAVTVTLTSGFQFSPLTSTRKIILLTLAAPLLGLALSAIGSQVRQTQTVLFAIIVGSLLWVLWPYLQRQELADAVAIGAGLSAFAAFTFLTSYSLRNRNLIAAYSSLSALAFGVGGASLLGASALYGQLSMSAGAGGLGILLAALLLKQQPSTGLPGILTIAMLASLIGGASVIYAKVPWYALLFLAIIPAIGHIQLSDNYKFFTKAVIQFAIAMIPASVAMAVVWHNQGPVPF